MLANLTRISNDYAIYPEQSLGSGATGQVYKGKCLRSNVDVAVKVIDLSTIDNQVTQYLLLMEKTAVMTVKNANVLRGLSIVENNARCYIVTELCRGGSLKDLLRRRGCMSQNQALKILIQLLKGECSLIQRGIIHRDLKPANVLIQNGACKIIDFGYCQIEGYTKPTLDYNVGSPSYMSPQAFLNNQYSQQSEVWALGVIFYQLLNSKTFDNDRFMGDVFKEIGKNGLPYNVSISQKCKTIISWCLQMDPLKRPTCKQLYKYVMSPQIPKILKNKSVKSLRADLTSRMSAPVDGCDQRLKFNQILLQNVSNRQYVQHGGRQVQNKSDRNYAQNVRKQVLLDKVSKEDILKVKTRSITNNQAQPQNKYTFKPTYYQTQTFTPTNIKPPTFTTNTKPTTLTPTNTTLTLNSFKKLSVNYNQPITLNSSQNQPVHTYSQPSPTVTFTKQSPTIFFKQPPSPSNFKHPPSPNNNFQRLQLNKNYLVGRRQNLQNIPNIYFKVNNTPKMAQGIKNQRMSFDLTDGSGMGRNSFNLSRDSFDLTEGFGGRRLGHGHRMSNYLDSLYSSVTER